MRNYKRVSLILALLALLGVVMTVSAQTPTATPVNPNVNISWPPPVYVLRGDFTVRGSANLPTMSNYFVQFRPLAADLTVPDENAPWLPATLPNTSAVQDGILGIWNTATVPDGVYELRLTVNVTAGDPVYFLVSPLRISNVPSPFEGTPIPAVSTQAPAQPTQALPTLLPTPTAFDPSPRATATRNANVRAGDGTNYDVIGSLQTGDSVPIVGISSYGTGWYLVSLPNGTRGWVAPSVVNVSGDLTTVPRVAPPPPPTATPVPVTATPTSQVNLVAGNFRFDPGSPKCNQTFNIYMDVANFGTVTSTSTSLTIQDFRLADGTFQESTVGGIPPIAPGQTLNVGPIPITVKTYYNEQHRLLMLVDGQNTIVETNEGDNAKEAIYTLEKAACP